MVLELCSMLSNFFWGGNLEAGIFSIILEGSFYSLFSLCADTKLILEAQVLKNSWAQFYQLSDSNPELLWGKHKRFFWGIMFPLVLLVRSKEYLLVFLLSIKSGVFLIRFLKKVSSLLWGMPFPQAVRMLKRISSCFPSFHSKWSSLNQVPQVGFISTCIVMEKDE